MKKLTRILYVEDNLTYRRIIRSLLTLEGYEILEAGDGLLALSIAERGHPDLILIDIDLPGIDGIECTLRLKKMPELANIPVVALTGAGNVEDRERMLAAGCERYLQKPVTPTELLTTLQQVLGIRTGRVQ